MQKRGEKILISACLMGFRVRYNGSDKKQVLAALTQWQREQRLVLHCPELAAGLPTPRLPAEIVGGSGADVLAGRARVVESDGRDMTQTYLLAAWLALETAQQQGCRFTLLSDGSPTCGSQAIYDGSFSGQRQPGAGVAAALLRQHNIAVYAEQQAGELLAHLNRIAPRLPG